LNESPDSLTSAEHEKKEYREEEYITTLQLFKTISVIGLQLVLQVFFVILMKYRIYK